MNDSDAYYHQFNHEFAKSATPLYFVGFRRSRNANDRSWRIYLFRTPDSKLYADNFRSEVRRIQLVDEVMSVPKVIASSVASLWFTPIEENDNWCYAGKWKCEYLKSCGLGRPDARCSKRGYEFVMGMIQGGR